MTQQEAKDLAAKGLGYADYAQIEMTELDRAERNEDTILVLQAALDIMALQRLKYEHKAEQHEAFLVELNELVDKEDSNTCMVGEFVMEYFDLWK